MKRPAVTWDNLDWPALDRLRQTFLSGPTPAEPRSYWESLSDLASYDFTYAQRIGWKWDAVIAELQLRGWRPPRGTLVDWGCGSGIASRCVLDGFGHGLFDRLDFFDRSPLATQFAQARAAERFPALPTRCLSGAEETCPPGDGPPRTLVVSHVLNELDESGGRDLRRAIDQANAVLWVEPGAYADSRSLIAMREALRDRFRVVAPCTHQASCGLLDPSNERHWCHHFAPPPAGIMADARWVQFARRAGIDLRTIPYSFLVLERRDAPAHPPPPPPSTEGWYRLVGQVRLYKGFAKVQSCDAHGVRDLELQRRDCPRVFKAMANGRAEPLYRWTLEGRWIRAAEEWPRGDTQT